MNDIETWRIFTEVREIFKKIQQISYIVNQTEKRYPSLDSLTQEELILLTKTYLSMGDDIEKLTQDWKRLSGEFKELTK